jgi:hypothetical protein
MYGWRTINGLAYNYIVVIAGEGMEEYRRVMKDLRSWDSIVVEAPKATLCNHRNRVIQVTFCRVQLENSFDEELPAISPRGCGAAYPHTVWWW